MSTPPNCNFFETNQSLGLVFWFCVLGRGVLYLIVFGLPWSRLEPAIGKLNRYHIRHPYIFWTSMCVLCITWVYCCTLLHCQGIPEYVSSLFAAIVCNALWTGGGGSTGSAVQIKCTTRPQDWASINATRFTGYKAIPSAPIHHFQISFW